MQFSKRFEKDLGKAITKRDALLADGAFSLPKHVGVLAILHSVAVPESVVVRRAMFSNRTLSSAQIVEKAKKTRDYEVLSMKEEAERLAQIYKPDYKRIEIIHATRRSIAEVLQDETVASIILSGHGSINHIYVQKEEDGEVEVFDWKDTYKSVTHLKSGFVKQRTCGDFSRQEGNVPLGLFSIKLLSNLHLPICDYVPPNPSTCYFNQIFNDEEGIVDQVLRLNQERVDHSLSEQT